MSKFYSLKNILKTDAVYHVIFGGRSNGKTFAVQEYAIQKYWSTGEQLAIIRRYRDDFIGKRGIMMFANQVSTGNVSKITGGVFNDVYYHAGSWYLCRYDEKGNIIKDEKPFCYGFSLTSMEHDKSTAYPEITNIMFDEFITRGMYLPDEFVIFMNVLSTIIRHRKNVKIFMIGNTVNKYCPYFSEMGLTHIKEMKPGTIDIYTYGESNLKVAVEFSENKKGQESSMYFAFDNPKLNMITGSEWELDIYPHCPIKYKPKHIKMTYFIKFDETLLQCEIISVDGCMFTFIHEKTTPLQHPDKDIIFTTEYIPKPNYSRNILKPVNEVYRRIAWFYNADKVYYQNNNIGDLVYNYLNWCKSH